MREKGRKSILESEKSVLRRGNRRHGREETGTLGGGVLNQGRSRNEREGWPRNKTK